MSFLKSSGSVGLELDTGVIRVVGLSGVKHEPSLVVASEIAIPKDAVTEGVVTDIDVVARALEELWAKDHIGSREVVLGISNKGVMMRLANFPKIPDSKLAQALRYQAGEYFPIPLAEMVLDHVVVGEVGGENVPQLQILLVAARRDLLDKSLQALQKAALTPRVVDTSPLALLRTLPGERLEGTVLLVDISNGLTTLLLVAGGVPRFARVIPHSLKSYARELDRPLDELLETVRPAASAVQDNLMPYAGQAVDEGQAWAVGAVPDWGDGLTPDDGQAPEGGRLPDGDHTPAAGQTADELTGEWKLSLANEICSSVGYYMAQSGVGAVDVVVISGRGARVAGLPEFLQSEVDVQVEIINPLVNIIGSARVKGVDLQRKGPDFAVSIGLALRGLEE